MPMDEYDSWHSSKNHKIINVYEDDNIEVLAENFAKEYLKTNAEDYSWIKTYYPGIEQQKEQIYNRVSSNFNGLKKDIIDPIKMGRSALQVLDSRQFTNVGLRLLDPSSIDKWILIQVWKCSRPTVTN